ncbi:maleylpyruvate isomerase family mycothiol-dependent enzyme [Streptomyces sp. SID13031]|uniref:maleylpyruvate isomerase family mycothiol-dependent enzyme n=1 Tax=Streptomyces sp. SID13031 TaxID=2706046 RepID=UPI0013C7686F|nr:maleylpyruvate isomerase family mycothiol-dependent enzyme [Streptomyces sp. SID13031]NEA34739.1 maleylpyruvate isomerase family mycothiol-dependent enzyme [Streptomyces sp. SID13031]
MSLPPERAAFYLACLQADSARLAEVGRFGLPAEVPSCPGWTVESVLRHVAQVYLHKIEILRLGARPDPWPPELDHRDAFELYDESRAAIVVALSEAGTELPTWTFSPTDKTSAFWYRRMALETAVHRVDAELAHNVVTPVDRELALDGIDEILTLMLGGPWWEEGDTEHPVDATIRITAAGRSWTTRLDATSATVVAGAEGDVDAEVFGDPDDIYLWLWGRRDLNLDQSAGNDAAAQEFRARVAECTT